MKIWQKTKEFAEGKFLVLRRDGTVFPKPHFVLGARDPAAPKALQAYAAAARDHGLDPEYCASVDELAADFEKVRLADGTGDPDAPPHRTDNHLVLQMMRGKYDLSDLEEAATLFERLRRQMQDMAALEKRLLERERAISELKAEVASLSADVARQRGYIDRVLEDDRTGGGSFQEEPLVERRIARSRSGPLTEGYSTGRSGKAWHDL